MTENIKFLKQKSEELQANTTFYESIYKELKETKKLFFEKSNVLREAIHKELDKYFDTIDEKIEIPCSTGLKSFMDQNQDTIAKMQACVDLTSKMDNLITKPDRELLAQGEHLLIQSNELSQSLAVPSSDDAEIPKVRLERRQDWILEPADFQLLRAQHRSSVSINLFQTTVLNSVAYYE